MALLNDEKIDFEGTVLELLEKEGINKENIVVLVNSEILKRELWSERKIKKEDYIEVVSFVGGG
ncbi:MAG: sulfur carrier protein ThiS [Caloramator sp.]|nr:sulfur carrier protein ThiS [Caloramator sp.]